MQILSNHNITWQFNKDPECPKPMKQTADNEDDVHVGVETPMPKNKSQQCLKYN